MVIKIKKIVNIEYNSSNIFSNETGYLIVGDKEGLTNIKYFKKHGKDSILQYNSIYDMVEEGIVPLVIFDCGEYSKFEGLKKEYNKKPLKETLEKLERELLKLF